VVGHEQASRTGDEEMKRVKKVLRVKKVVRVSRGHWRCAAGCGPGVPVRRGQLLLDQRVRA
jgi:hypothetical protein